MSKSKKIIIVGAGPGGLCAGMLLSHRGFEVTIFDKNEEVGGRSRPLHLNQFTFDTGPTFLLMKGVLDEMFLLCDRRTEDYLEFQSLSPMYQLKFIDRDFNVYSNPEKMKLELQHVFGEASEGYFDFLENEKRRFNALYPCMTRDYTNLGRFFSFDLIKAIPWLAFPKSVFCALIPF